ncbi:MAG: PEP-CTERM sorting domain-containing protein [Pacificimonas sp.]|jgi:hypothetical protein|nr:PEP-CTERM sorting domain-containing protein [Pacificimonas sp.]
MRFILTAATAATMSTGAMAAAVDLSSWTAEDHGSSSSSSNWQVQGPGNDAVFQSVNGQPSVFFEAGSNSQGRQLSGSILSTGSDDDYIGFVLGYDAGDLNSANGEFLLIDWNQGAKSFGVGANSPGLSVSLVSGNIGASAANFWAHTGPVQEIERGATLGSTGWVRGQSYDFDLVFQSTFLQVFVDGNLELDINASDAGLTSFDDGAFGFYNYSQASVLYSGIIEDVAPPDPRAVPAPGALGLLGLGALLLGARRRR